MPEETRPIRQTSRNPANSLAIRDLNVNMVTAPPCVFCGVVD